MSRTEHLVTVDALAAELETSFPPVLLDVRWRLFDEPEAGWRRYLDQHLPGARFLDLERVLTGHTDNPRDGRHPLPDLETLVAGLRELGVSASDDLVVYDDPGSFAADRAWWVLRWVGLRARVLDGGLPAWVAGAETTESGKREAEPEPPLPSRSMGLDGLHTGQLSSIDADEAARFPEHGVLVDCRAPNRFSGEYEPLDPRAGHIPGAVNISAATLFTDDGHLPADDELHRRLAGLIGVTEQTGATEQGPVAAYCGSGVSAAHDVLALAVLGRDAALFPGSWSAWSNDPDRPAATGSGSPGSPPAH